MGAYHQSGGTIHHIEIEGHIGMQSIPTGKYVGVGACLNKVAILLLLGGETCVEFRIGFLRVQNADIGRQMGIQGDGELVRRHTGLRIEVRHLGTGVDAGVRAAAALKAAALAGDLEDGLFDLLLHGDTVGLSLPAHVVCAVILDYGPYASHIR